MTLKEEILRDIQTSKEEHRKRQIRNSLSDHLIEHHKFEVPKSMIENQAMNLMSWIEDDHKQKGQKAPEWKEQDLQALKTRAERMVKSALLLQEVAEKEKIELDETQLESRIQKISEQLNQGLEDTRKWLSGRGMLDRLRDEVLTDQVFDFLAAHATIERSPK